jgi:hypothetical protein
MRKRDAYSVLEAHKQPNHARRNTQALNSHKRAAQSRVLKMKIPNLGETRG